MQHVGGTETVTPVEVVEVRPEASGVLSLTVRGCDGAELPTWSPGAHADLILSDDLERQYSLCGLPDERNSWMFAVLREPQGRGGSAFVHGQVAAGDRLSVRGPRNHFPLVDAAEYLFVAGGIGVTPILPMIREVSKTGRSWRMLYGGRSRASMAFLSELSEYGDRITIAPEDETGLLDLSSFLIDQSAGTAVYCCGPTALLDAVEAMSIEWQTGTLHVERFAPKVGALEGTNSEFKVVLEQTGTTIAVAADQTIVEALEQAGLDVDTSCREGTCGTCETTVLEGLPDHRDSVLSASEQARNDVMMICCSRALSETLVLDL